MAKKIESDVEGKNVTVADVESGRCTIIPGSVVGAITGVVTDWDGTNWRIIRAELRKAYSEAEVDAMTLFDVRMHFKTLDRKYRTHSPTSQFVQLVPDQEVDTDTSSFEAFMATLDENGDPKPDSGKVASQHMEVEWLVPPLPMNKLAIKLGVTDHRTVKKQLEPFGLKKFSDETWTLQINHPDMGEEMRQALTKKHPA
jgi:hypothetical protein